MSMNRATLLLVGFGVCFVTTSHGEDWYRFRGPTLDGISSETGWRSNWSESPPRTIWTASVGTGLSSVVISDGRLYTMGNEDNRDTVYCLDCATGKEVWKYSYDCPTDPNEFEGGPTSTPTVAGDDLYTLSRRGDLFRFDKQSGKVHWQVNVAELAEVRIPGWGFAGSPLVMGDRLILNVGDAGTAVHRDTGRLVWASADKDSGYSSIVPFPKNGGEDVIIASARSYVCVDASSGREKWRQRWLTTFGCNAADALVFGDQVFLSSGYNRGSALLDLSSGQPSVVWKHKEMQTQLSTSVLIDGYVYGVHGDVAAGAKLRCLEWATGVVAWTYEPVRAAAVIAGPKRLIVLSDSGELLVAIASPEGFEPSGRLQVLDGKCWTTPVLSGGRIYCRSADGRLACVDVE